MRGRALRFFGFTCICIYELIALALPAHAQSIIPAQAHQNITLDGTLPGPGRQAKPLSGPDYQILHTDGHEEGTNLFHSFGKFSLLSNETATFIGPEKGTDVTNVISRVTGGEVSVIDGTITSTMPKADFWFLNPAGITFKENARLDVPGSFHVSTANELRFEDGSVFRAATPNGPEVLSVASPQAFGFLSMKPSPIAVGGLNVEGGRRLLVVGGDITVNGRVSAKAGEVILASVASKGRVLATGEPDFGIALGNVTIHDGTIDVSGDGGGRVQIRGGTFTMTGKTKDSLVDASNRGSKTPTHEQFVDIEVTESFNLLKSRIESDADPGHAGGVRIVAGHLALDDSQIFSRALNKDNTRNAGDMVVTTRGDVTLENASTLSAVTTGPGDGGDIKLDVGGVIYLGNSSITTAPITTAPVNSESTAPIDTDFRVGATGAGGNIFIDAGEITMAGVSGINAGYEGGISLSPFLPPPGRSGAIDIILSPKPTPEGSTTGNLLLRDKADVSTYTLDAPGGAIRINAKEVNMSQKAGIGTSAFGASDAGDIVIDAERVVVASDREGIFALTTAAGRGGTIDLDVTDTLTVSGANINAQTTGSGAGGDIIIRAGSITVNNEGIISAEAFVSERAKDPEAAAALLGAPGKIDIDVNGSITVDGAEIINTTRNRTGGTMSVTADSLRVLNGGRIDSSTFGPENGGEITINVNQLEVSGTGARPSSEDEVRSSAIASRASRAGAGGSIRLLAHDALHITNNAAVTAQSTGEGKAGSITLFGGRLVQVDGESKVTSQADQATGGTVRIGDDETIGIPRNIVLDQATITTEVAGPNPGGSINLEAGSQLQLLGKTQVTARSVGESNAGNAGNIDIAAGDRILFSENSEVTTEARQASGGNITLKAPHMIYLLDSEITSSVFGPQETRGGNITIDPQFLILNDSNIIARAFEGRGGEITLRGNFIIPSSDSSIDAKSDFGVDGTVVFSNPEVDIEKGLVELPVDFLDVSSQMPQSCEARRIGGESSFTLRGRGGLQPLPGELTPAFYRTDSTALQDGADGSVSGSGTTALQLEPDVPMARFAVTCSPIR